jgi:hypothetical protein
MPSGRQPIDPLAERSGWAYSATGWDPSLGGKGGLLLKVARSARSVRRAMHPGCAVKRAVTPKAVKKARRAMHPIDNAVYSVQRSAATSIRSGRKRKARAYHHGNCPVNHRSPEAAASAGILETNVTLGTVTPGRNYSDMRVATDGIRLGLLYSASGPREPSACSRRPGRPSGRFALSLWHVAPAGPSGAISRLSPSPRSGDVCPRRRRRTHRTHHDGPRPFRTARFNGHCALLDGSCTHPCVVTGVPLGNSIVSLTCPLRLRGWCGDGRLTRCCSRSPVC